MRTFTFVSYLTISIFAGACGGGGDAGPTPLAHHFDDMHIAAVPMGDKNDVFQAQNDFSVAKAEHQKAQADYDNSGTELSVAKNEREQALLAEKSAQSRKKSADDSSDMTRVNQAASEQRAAELQRKASDEKVTYMKAHRKYLKKWVRYTKEEMYAKEAKFELAKAKVAQQKSIRPKGFELKQFEKQYRTRSERAQRAKAKANQLKSKAETRKKKWESTAQAAKSSAGNVGSSSE